MKIVIDSSPLISLTVIDQLELLERLFSTVIVPQAVYREVKAAKNRSEYERIVNFIKNRVYLSKEEKNMRSKLGDGETEAITLYFELNADLLIIDDKKARNEAKSKNIKFLGTLGILTLAKRKGFIRELRGYFIELIKNQRYFPIELMNQILTLNQEDTFALE